MTAGYVFLCPGQGAQVVGMGKAWIESSAAAANIFRTADEVTSLGARRLSEFCLDGPQEELNRTDVSQPALFTCGIASHAALVDRHPGIVTAAANGLSLGEYTALCIAGAFGFACSSVQARSASTAAGHRCSTAAVANGWPARGKPAAPSDRPWRA